MSKLFWAMLSFITRLPVPRRWSQGLDFEHYSRGIISFPLIGLLLGAISGLVFMVLQAWCGAPLAALFSVLVLVLMTGGFHLDGLADTCDGVFSARSRDRMLEIMRDSRLGTHGGLALIFVVLAKILVLSELALRGESILASLAAACAVSRGTTALLMYRHRYATRPRTKARCITKTITTGGIRVNNIAAITEFHSVVPSPVAIIPLIPATVVPRSTSVIINNGHKY